MESSVDRRISMEKHLNDVVGPDKHFRIRAVSLADIYIPADIQKSWAGSNAKYETTEIIPPKSEVTSSSKFWPYKIILSSLFGRRKGNTLKELGCTISHLIAMRQAINEANSPSKYALIIEDDVQFLFNVDWDALVATGKLLHILLYSGIIKLASYITSFNRILHLVRQACTVINYKTPCHKIFLNDNSTIN